MDEEEVDAGEGRGGDRVAELPGSSGGRPQGAAALWAQRRGVFWGA